MPMIYEQNEKLLGHVPIESDEVEISGVNSTNYEIVHIPGLGPYVKDLRNDRICLFEWIDLVRDAQALGLGEAEAGNVA